MPLFFVSSSEDIPVLDDQEFLDDGAVDEAVEESTGQDSTGTDSDGQPRKKVNLDEFPEFRQVKSKYDQQVAKATQETVKERQARIALEQRVQQMEARMEQAQTANMPEGERAKYEYQKLMRQYQGLQQQMQAQQVESARMATLQEIANETGAPMAELEKAENPDDAWRIGARFARNGGGDPENSREERNRVDVGTGRTRSKGSDLQAQYNAAMKSFDTGKALEIMHRADVDGVQLKL